jgi:homoserine acetyltransferase
MTVSAPVEFFKSPDFALDCGTTLPSVVVAYQTYGKRVGADGAKCRVVLVSTCFGETVSDVKHRDVDKTERMWLCAAR